MYALGRACIGAGHGIGVAQTAKLLGARVVCHWLDNARPSSAPQGHAGVAG